MNGFTLVEILVTSLIIMLGVTGYVTLQSQYVLANTEINLRYLASQLAHEKVNDLAFFEQIESKAGKYAFNNIQSNSGGAIAAGPIYVALTTDAKNSYLYNINWLVVDYFYVDTNGDTQPDSWVQAGEPFYPQIVPWVADLKTAQVEVSWLSHKGLDKKITVFSQISPILPSNSFHSKFRSISASSRP